MQHHIIVYHSNCMDGLSSAFIAKEAISNLKDDEDKIYTLPLYYGDEYKLFNLITDISLESRGKIFVTMVDFSFKEPEMRKLIDLNNIHVTVLDHHGTAEEQLANIEQNNFEFFFDNDKSGAIITYEHFLDHHELEPELFCYVQDRDLWNWQMTNTKEISACLHWETTPNDIDSFANWYYYYEEMDRNDREYSDMVTRGQAYTHLINTAVDRKKMNARQVTINNQPIMIINASDNISELGHAICKEFNMPSCMFFYTTSFEVVLSFRSENHLEPAVNFAKSFKGGGGHQNAAGAKITQKQLQEILKG